MPNLQKKSQLKEEKKHFHLNKSDLRQLLTKWPPWPSMIHKAGISDHNLPCKPDSDDASLITVSQKLTEPTAKVTEKMWGGVVGWLLAVLCLFSFNHSPAVFQAGLSVSMLEGLFPIYPQRLSEAAPLCEYFFPHLKSQIQSLFVISPLLLQHTAGVVAERPSTV